MIGHTLQINNNSFFIEKKLRKKLPYSILTFFLMLQFIFGLNFGFIDALNKKIRHFCRLTSIVICLYTGIILFLSTPLFLSEWNMKEVGVLLIFIQYCGFIVLLNFTKYKVYNFITDIRSINDGILRSKEHKIGLFPCIIFGCFLGISLILTVFVCMFQKVGCLSKNYFVAVMYQIALTSLDEIVLVQLIVNFYTYYAVKHVVGLVGKGKVSLIRKQFLRISECCEKFGGHYENLVSIYVTMNYLLHTYE